MRILVENLGILRKAEFELGDLTIICGRNNTGKTYVTYALFGFLKFWKEMAAMHVSSEKISRLLSEGGVELHLPGYMAGAEKTLATQCSEFSQHLLPKALAANPKHFSESSFAVSLDWDNIRPISSFERRIGSAKARFFSVVKEEGADIVDVALLVDREKVKMSGRVIGEAVGYALKDIIFANALPDPFIASAERTGAAIFRKELDFARNRLLDEMASESQSVDPFKLLSKAYADYAVPIQFDVDFTRKLESLQKEESFVLREHPDLLDDFADIIGGRYVVTKNSGIQYAPQGSRVRLNINESSSAVRSLLDIGFYLRHAAKKGDLLMIDEPELNLHPENQRKMARLFARLLSIGLRVFVTTHSDYLVKELNTLIMLNQNDERLAALARREGYRQEELLDPGRVRLYIAEEALVKIKGATRKVRRHTLKPADIDGRLGIEVRSFDDTIADMNRVQEEIVFGEDE